MKKEFYELTFIVNPVLEEAQYKEVVTKFTGLLEANGAEIESTDEWGIRKFAYDIDKKSSGYYINMFFHAPGKAIEIVERNMRIDDNVMRYLTLKYDSKMLKHHELVKKGEAPTLFEEVEEETEETDR